MDAVPGTDPLRLPVHAHGRVVAVIETPSGSGNKLKFDTELGIFRLDRVLPAGMSRSFSPRGATPGMSFSFDFGFIPQTLAEDGDPLDVIVLLDSPLYPGCAIEVRMIGVLLAEQQDGGVGPWVRNDRLVAVAGGPKGHSSVRAIRDVDRFRVEAIESFFTTCHGLDGDRFRGHGGTKVAADAIKRAHAAFLAQSKASKT